MTLGSGRCALAELRHVRDVIVRLRDAADGALPPEQVADLVAMLPALQEVLDLGGESEQRFAELYPERVVQLEVLSARLYGLLGMPLAREGVTA